MKRIAWCVGAVLALSAGVSSAEICRWKDANGRTQYSDSPPPGAKCEGTVRAPSTAPGAAAAGNGEAAAGPKTYQEKEMEFRKRRLDKQEAEKKAQADKEQQAAKKATCDSARSRVAGLQHGGRVAKYDANGQIMFLDDADIARELADARRTAEQACR
jgi:hypothetical protein